MSEPLKARSALGFRAVLSATAWLLALIAGVVLLVVAPGSGESRTPYVVSAIICLAVMVIASIDLVVIVRRRHRESPQPGG